MNTNCYQNQKERAISRKKELVELLGGKCEKCGYHENYAALEFHHINPDNKKFQLDSRHLSNTSMDLIIEEAKKCQLLCSNCHKEIHYPQFSEDKIKEYCSNKKSLFEDKKKQSICPVCGKSFDSSKGKIFCNKECRQKQKNYPSKQEVQEKYNELHSQQKVANFYGLTRKIIINILKK